MRRGRRSSPIAAASACVSDVTEASAMDRLAAHAVATAQVSVAGGWDMPRVPEVRTADLAARHRPAAEAAGIVAAAEAMALTSLAHGENRSWPYCPSDSRRRRR